MKKAKNEMIIENIIINFLFLVFLPIISIKDILPKNHEIKKPTM